MTHYVHNPGTIVPVAITADALRYFFNASVQRATIAHNLTVGSFRPGSVDERLANLHKHVASQYRMLAHEINEAKITTPGSDRSLDEYVSAGIIVIGAGLYTVRADEWAAEVAALAEREEKQSVERLQRLGAGPNRPPGLVG